VVTAAAAAHLFPLTTATTMMLLLLLLLLWLRHLLSAHWQLSDLSFDLATLGSQQDALPSSLLQQLSQ
jgi:hypothetical protein